MRDILRRNLGYKIISVVLAIIFWLWITSLSQPTSLFGKTTINVPLVTYNQPPNLVITSNIPPITVQIDSDNKGISVEDFYAYVDLTDAVAGEKSYPVQMHAPEGVKIESISPSSVVISLDTVKDKIVPVLLDITGEPARGYEIKGEIILEPSVVNVRGPASILDKLESVTVEANVTGMKQSVRLARPVIFKDIKEVGLFAPDPNLESLNAFPDTVEIIIPIYPKDTASKTLPLRVTTSGQPAEGMMVRSISTVPSQIQLIGEAEALDELQYLNVGPVDVSGLTSDKIVDFPIDQIELPENTVLPEGTRITVIIDIGPSLTEKTISDIPVNIRNLPEGLTAESIPPIAITVNGYPEIVNPLTAGDFSVWVDVANLAPGTYPNKAVLWQAPTGVTVVNVPSVRLVLKSTEPENTDENQEETANSSVEQPDENSYDNLNNLAEQRI